MRNRHVACVVAAALLGLAGCAEKCPTESPGVDAVQSCTVRPGASVSMRVRVCERCNQTATTCQVDIQGGTIQLDPVSEACTDSAGCPPGCNLDPNITCTFTAPATEGTYDVLVYDPNTNTTLPAQLVVSSTLPFSCTFPT
jgi:predicted small lipoprotein YifL